MTTPELSWYGTEDGYVIIGTTDRTEADKLHDELVEEHLAGDKYKEESKSDQLDPPKLFYVRPDHMTVDDEDTRLDIDPATGQKHTSLTGLPALFYNQN